MKERSDNKPRRVFAGVIIQQADQGPQLFLLTWILVAGFLTSTSDFSGVPGLIFSVDDRDSLNQDLAFQENPDPGV